MATDRSPIEWTDTTWNPVRGCSRVSAGCENCYAERVAWRFKGEGKPYEGLVREVNGRPVWTGQIRLLDAALNEPRRWRKPRRVFVNSMSDLFHQGVPTGFIDRVFLTMALSPQHQFQVLTKRPDRMLQYVLEAHGHRTQSLHAWVRGGGAWPPANVWLGVSVEDQATADQRVPLLLETPAAVRWVSYEPALGPVDFEPYLHCPRCGYTNDDAALHLDHNLCDGKPNPPVLDWVVVGGESGPGAREFNVRWAVDTVKACKAAGVPVFVKQIGSLPIYWCAGRLADPDPDVPYDDDFCDGYEASEHGHCSMHFTQRCAWIGDRSGRNMNEWPPAIRVREYPA